MARIETAPLERTSDDPTEGEALPKTGGGDPPKTDRGAFYGTALDRAADRERAGMFFAAAAAGSGIFAVASHIGGGPHACHVQLVFPHVALAVVFIVGYFWVHLSWKWYRRIEIVDGVTYGLASAIVGVLAVAEGGLTSTVVHLLPCLAVAQGLTLRDSRAHRALRLGLSTTAFFAGDWLAHRLGMSVEEHAVETGDWLSDALEAMIYQGLVTVILLGAPTVSDARPRSVGRYVLEKHIGDGGMADVWLGHGPASPHAVAIKVMHVKKLGPQTIMRFGREIAALAELRHPSTVRILDWGVADGELYYVMELLHGETLRALVRREGPLTAERAVRIVREIARAMIEAHGHGIIHRDIKPDNVFVLPGDAVKLLDFGVAKVPVTQDHDDDESVITRVGTAVGTPWYMAPEQILTGPVDARTDVYALGATLFFTLTGQAPFLGTASQVFRAHLQAEIPDPSAHSPHPIRADLRSTVLRCLQKDPDRRFTSMAVLEGALTALLEGDTSEAPPREALSGPPTPRIRTRRRRSLFARRSSLSAPRMSDAPPTTRRDRPDPTTTISDTPVPSLRALALRSLVPPTSGRVSIRPLAHDDLPDTVR